MNKRLIEHHHHSISSPFNHTASLFQISGVTVPILMANVNDIWQAGAPTLTPTVQAERYTSLLMSSLEKKTARAGTPWNIFKSYIKNSRGHTQPSLFSLGAFTRLRQPCSRTFRPQSTQESPRRRPPCRPLLQACRPCSYMSRRACEAGRASRGPFGRGCRERAR